MGKRPEKNWKTTRKFHKAKHSYTQGMLTITKYAFIAIAIILAILALNFGRSKVILTGSQNVSLAFYRYEIQETDITVEYPSNVLARITPTEAEQTLMQNTGLVMQYKIDYTDTNLTDVGWTTYNNQNQPALLDDCTISCRYYGAPATSGGVAFTGPETTKEIKLPKIKTLDGTTLILTKAGTADTTDSFVKAADYYGEAIDYQGNTSDTKTYRLFYVDYEDPDGDGKGKYGDDVGTIYLKADWTANDVNPATHSTYVPQNTKDSEIIANMNPEWRDQIDANDDGIINANELNYINAHASAWLASPSQWTEYANGNANKTGNTMYTYTPISSNTSYEINYAIASPSVEMFIDSHNESFDLSYLYNSDIYGYMFSVNNGTNWDSNTGSNTINTGKNGMYVTEGQRYTWLCSPSPALYQQWLDYQSIYYVGGDLRRLIKNQCDTELGISPLVSIKPTTINTVGNYVELNASNRIVKGYNTLTSALSTVTNENTIKPLKDMTETVAPALASGKTAIIDLNDKTITLDNLTLTNNGTLNITGTSGELTASAVDTITNTGTLTKSGDSKISNSAAATYYAIRNSGTATLSAGTINGNYGVIENNAAGKLLVSGASIEGTRYGIINTGTSANENSPSVKIESGTVKTETSNAISNDGEGTIVIEGGTVCSETTSGPPTILNYSTGKIVINGGTINSGNTSLSQTGNGSQTEIRGATITGKTGVVISNGSLIITGGTITATTVGAYCTGGILTIGNNSDTVSTSTPSITGATYGVQIGGAGTFNFYDGIIKVPTGNTPISGIVSATPTGYSVKYGTTTENGTTYDTAYLGNIHVVTLDADGGTIPATTDYTVAPNGATATKSITYGNAYGTLPTPTRTGYTFAGWSRNLADEISYANYTITNYHNFTTSEIKNDGAFAGLTNQSYIRTYGNSSTTNIDTAWSVESTNSLNVISGENYTFSYYVRSKNAVTTQYMSSSNDAWSTCVIWGNGTYTYLPSPQGFPNDGEWHLITLNVTAPSGVTWAKVKVGNDPPNLYGTGSYIDIANIQFCEDATTTPYFIESDDTMQVPCNHTLHAHWTANTYTVVYNGNGSTGGSTASSTHTYDTAKALTTNGYTKTGYTFALWSTSASDVVRVNDSNEYRGTHASGASGYADFKAYNIAAPFASGEVYQLDVDVKGSGTLVNYFYGSDNYLRVASWTSPTSGESGTRVDGGNTIPLTSNYTHYTVRFILGSNGDGSVQKRVLFRAMPGCDAYIKNIKFTKVSANSTAYVDQQSVKNLTTASGGTVNLYAHWTANTLTINPNGGTFNGTTSNTVIEQGNMTTYSVANNPTRPGYIFNGWTLNGSGTNTLFNTTSTATTTTTVNYDSSTSTLPNAYNSAGGDAVTRQMVADSTATGGYSLQVKTNGPAGPGAGGISLNIWPGVAGRINVLEVKAKIPTGYSLKLAGIGSRYTGIGSGYRADTLAGTGEWKTYYCVVYSGDTGNFTQFAYLYVDGTNNRSVTWNIDSIVMKSFTKDQFKSLYTFGDGSGTLQANWNTGGARVLFNINGGIFDTNYVVDWVNGYNMVSSVAAGRYYTYNTSYATAPAATNYDWTPDTRVATRSGYVLDGWYTSATGGTKVFNSNGTLVSSVSGYSDSSGRWIKYDANVTLYAQWKEDRSIQVGDLVNYNANRQNAAGSTFSTPYTYTTKTTESTAGNEYTGGTTATSFSSADTMTWKVLSVNENTGAIELIAADGTPNTVELKEAAGYAYSENILNKVSEVYGHGYGATGARSVTVEDINELTGYTPAGSKTQSYTSGGPFVELVKNASGVVTSYKEKAATTSNPVTVTADQYYTYTGSTYITDTTSNEYRMIFQNTSGSSRNFWLASRCVLFTSSSCFFTVRFVYSGGVSISLLYASGGSVVGGNKGYAVSPVVTLDSNIQLTWDSANNCWNIN